MIFQKYGITQYTHSVYRIGSVHATYLLFSGVNSQSEANQIIDSINFSCNLLHPESSMSLPYNTSPLSPVFYALFTSGMVFIKVAPNYSVMMTSLELQ